MRVNERSERPSGPFKTRLSRVETGPLYDQLKAIRLFSPSLKLFPEPQIFRSPCAIARLNAYVRARDHACVQNIERCSDELSLTTMLELDALAYR